jgi:hypothetical protein
VSKQGIWSLLLALVIGACASRSSSDAVSDVEDTGAPDVSLGDIGPGDGAEAVDGADGPCLPDYETRCVDELTLEQCIDGAWVHLADCLPGTACAGGMCVDRQPCLPGSIDGCQSELAQWVCDASGDFYVPTPCPEGQYCLDGVCGDALCVPGQTLCQDEVVLLRCNEDGSEWIHDHACPVGEVCVQAGCISGCKASVKHLSHIGCVYWTVDLDQYEDPFGNPEEVPHSIVIANTNEVTTTLLFEPSDPTHVVDIPDPTVLPGEARAFQLPRWDIDGNGIFNRSVRVTSSHPVIAIQFNPFNNAQVASNDASLLLPEEALGTRYFVLSYPTSPNDLFAIEGFEFAPQLGYFTVVATSPGATQVTVRVTGYVFAEGVVPAMSPGDEQMFVLQQGEVLNLASHKADITMADVDYLDLTGSEVTSDKPVAVFGGHEEAVVGWSGDGGENCCAEHMEEQLFPVDTWGSHIVCAKTKPRGGEPDIWRVMAALDGTELHTDPPLPADGVVLGKGEWIEFEAFESFELDATGPIQVGQYTVGQLATSAGTGDPDLILAIPSAQYRETYPIAVPEGYAHNALTIVRPTQAPVMVDGVQLDASVFSPVGPGVWEVGYVDLTAGVHSVWSPQPVGVYAYGYDSAVSYGYPAGLNLGVQ